MRQLLAICPRSAGVPSWAALFIGGLHPALALVPIVAVSCRTARATPGCSSTRPRTRRHAEPVRARWQGPVQGILLLFALVNAGVRIQEIGTGTWAVFGAIPAGKPIGIAARCGSPSRGAEAARKRPRPRRGRHRLRRGDRIHGCACSSRPRRFRPDRCSTKTKLGALLSVASAAVAVGVARAAAGGPVQGFAGVTSLTMNTFSPGLISPSSRRAISSIARGILASVAAPLRAVARFPRARRAIVAASASYSRRARMRREQAAIADELVHDDDRSDEQRAANDDPAGCAPDLARAARVAESGRLDVVASAREKTVQQLKAKYKAKSAYGRARMTTHARSFSRQSPTTRGGRARAPLVDERLAACVNVDRPDDVDLPLERRGRTARPSARLVIKTTRDRLEALEQRIMRAAPVRAAGVSRRRSRRRARPISAWSWRWSTAS